MTERAEPTIAVIVSNRNDSRYLPRCLRSVFDQVVGPDELIVVDDRSTDNSVSVIRALIEGRPGSALICNPVNLGVYGAMHEGLKHSRSEYALFLASNDFVLPGIFARAKRCIAQAPGAGLWSAMAWIVDEEDRPLRMHASPVVSLRDTFLSPQECLELAYRHGNWFTGPTLIYRRGPLDEAGRFDKLYMGLSDLFTALIVASRHGAAYSPVPLCATRKHAGGYLTRTLIDPAQLEHILQRLSEFGSRVEPKLFTPAFNERTVRRFRFASVRTSGGATMAAIAEISSGRVRSALQFFDRLLPRAWRFLRVAAVFFILRPFDVLPSLWNRVLGWIFVRSRHRWPAPRSR
jgi:glycosyltransferase involved in cell wall biosynthesis